MQNINTVDSYIEKRTIHQRFNSWEDGLNRRESLIYSLYSKKATSIAIGVFDGVHRGHRAIIEKAISNTHITPIVFTFSDLSSHGGKKSSLITTPTLKNKLIRKWGINKIYSAKFEEIKDVNADDFLEKYLKNELNVKQISCGGDFRFGKDNDGNVILIQKFCAANDIEACFIEEVKQDGERISSTRIKDYISAGNMEQASLLLGYDYTMDFPVQKGKGLARTLNYPTINQHYPSEYIIPAFGVYATYVTIDGKRIPSITNVGTSPTLGAEEIKSETFIFDYKGNLYDQNVELSFIKHFRGEKKFGGLNELTSQMSKDISAVKKYFESNPVSP